MNRADLKKRLRNCIDLNCEMLGFVRIDNAPAELLETADLHSCDYLEHGGKLFIRKEDAETLNLLISK